MEPTVRSQRLSQRVEPYALPMPKMGSTATMERLLKLSGRESKRPRPPMPSVASHARRRQRLVHIQVGDLTILDGDEITKSCKWQQEACDTLEEVRDDITKLDQVLHAESDKLYSRRGELILGAFSKNDVLRSTLQEPPEHDSNRQVPGSGGEVSALETYMHAQLKKLASIHPQGYTGVLHHVTQGTLAHAVLDVESEQLIQRVKGQVERCFVRERGPVVSRKLMEGNADEGFDFSEVLRENDEVMRANVPSVVEYSDSSVQCDMLAEEKAAAQAAADSSAKNVPAAQTARNCLLSLHDIVLQLTELVGRFLSLEGSSVLTEDEMMVTWSRTCRADLRSLGQDTLNTGILTHLQDLKHSSLTGANASAQPNVAVVGSAMGHITELLSYLVNAATDSTGRFAQGMGAFSGR